MVCCGAAFMVGSLVSLVFSTVAMIPPLSYIIREAKKIHQNNLKRKKLKRYLKIVEAVKSCGKEAEGPNGTMLYFTLEELRRELDNEQIGSERK